MVTGAASTASSVTAEVRPWWETGLQRGNEGEKKGKRWRSSPRLQWASKRARGRPECSELTVMISGGRGGERRCGRRCRASGGPWSGGEEEGVEAEPLHAMAGGERCAGNVVGLAREGGGPRGEGEPGRGLTAVLLVLLARQGRHGVRRNDGGDHRRPRSRSAALEMQQGFWRSVTCWRGRRRRGGARGYVGEARGRLWVRQRRAVATSSARLSRERDKGGDEHGGRSERARGGAWRRPEGSGRPTKQEVAKRVGARGGHTPSCPLA